MPDHHSIAVDLPSCPYTITVGAGALASLGTIGAPLLPGRRVLMAVDANVAATHGETAGAALEGAGFHVTTHVVEATEKNKSLDTVGAMYDAMFAARLRRDAAVVAVGGGIVGDVAGFAAATFLRGIALVQVPTTLLAMVDASIGGKTGVNYVLPDSTELGKNLIGAFWQPRAVVADPRVLETLDDRQLACGLGECVKHALIADPGLLEQLESESEVILAREPQCLERLIARSTAVKVDLVVRDEREGGPRALLNLGHTFAHAIEPVPELELYHGEAVAIGLAAAARVAVRTGRLDDDQRSRIEALLERLALPVRLAAPVAVDRLMHLMSFDKKAGEGGLRLILPAGLGAAEIVEGVPADLIEQAWIEVGAQR